MLTRLIAEKDKTEPKAITIKYIRQQREKLIYPNARHNIGSNYC